jgi:phospholipid/cholesterol/gamma-HCH transport system substrate-binding protein
MAKQQIIFQMKPIQKKQSMIVGAFIFFGVVILLIAVLTLGGRNKIFEKTFTLSVVFKDVTGLQKGNNIWYSGVKIGTVDKVKILGQSNVEVVMKIEKEFKDFILRDSKAKIGSDGLIGNRIVIIYDGTPGMPVVQPGDRLQPEAPLNSAEMMNTLQESNKNLSAITSDFKIVSKKLAGGEGTIGELIANDSMANHLEATAIMLKYASSNIQLLTENLAGYTAKMQRKGALTYDLVNDTMFYTRLKAASLQIQEASENAKELTGNLREVSYRLRDSSNLAGVVFQDQKTAANLRTAVENIQSGTKKFDENMEALQHNFLFRGFFRKRAKQQQQQQKENQSKTLAEF